MDNIGRQTGFGVEPVPRVIGWLRWMVLVLMLLGLGLALAGCEPAQSVYPFVDPAQATLEPRLVGQWKEIDPPASDEHWLLEIKHPDETSSQYVLRYGFADGGGTTSDFSAGEYVFEGYVFAVARMQYLDLLTKEFRAKPKQEVMDFQVDSGLFTSPTHTVYRMWLEGDHLKLAYLDDECVERFLKDANLKLGTTGLPRFLLTAPTEELQGKILAEAEEASLLDSEGLEFVRQE